MFGYFFCRHKHNDLCILRIQRFSPFTTDSKNYKFFYSSHQSRQRWHGSHKAKSAPLLPSVADGQDLIIFFIRSFIIHMFLFKPNIYLFQEIFSYILSRILFFFQPNPYSPPYALFSNRSSTLNPIGFFQMNI